MSNWYKIADSEIINFTKLTPYEQILYIREMGNSDLIRKIFDYVNPKFKKSGSRYEIINEILHNSNTPSDIPEVLWEEHKNSLLDSPYPKDIILQIAKSPASKEELLIRLLKLGNFSIIRSLSENRNIPTRIGDILFDKFSDKSSYVRDEKALLNLINNDRLSKDNLEKIAKNAVKNKYSSPVLQSLINNPNCPIELFFDILNKNKTKSLVFQSAYEHLLERAWSLEDIKKIKNNEFVYNLIPDDHKNFYLSRIRWVIKNV